MVTDCIHQERPEKARGLCGSCYNRWNETGLAGAQERRKGFRFARGERQPWRHFIASRLKLPTDPREIGYVGGLIDGEGCIARRITDGRPFWRLEIGMTHEPTIRWLQRIGGRVYAVQPRGKPSYLPQWHWCLLAQREVMELLEAVLPILITKRALGEGAVAEIRARSEEQGIPTQSINDLKEVK